MDNNIDEDWFDKMCQKHEAKNYWKKEKPKKQIKKKKPRKLKRPNKTSM